MSPADSDSGERFPRPTYAAELEQLRLQVEMMGMRVDQNLERMRDVLATGNGSVAAAAFAADDEIDAMNVSLTEKCYGVLVRESPMASDLRLVVSVIRVISELERTGDLALRVVKLAPQHQHLTASARSFDILMVMCDEAIDRYRAALRAWGSNDIGVTEALVTASPIMELYNNQLTESLLAMHGPDAVADALPTLTAGRALDRIADHAAILGSRLRYLITGDPNHLAAEVR